MRNESRSLSPTFSLELRSNPTGETRTRTRSPSPSQSLSCSLEPELALSTGYRTPSPKNSYPFDSEPVLRKRSRKPSSTASTSSQTPSPTSTPPLARSNRPEKSTFSLSQTEMQPLFPLPPRQRHERTGLQTCPHCPQLFTHPISKDIHILQVHILKTHPKDPHLERLSEMPYDPGNFSGPLGINAHFVEPERFLAEEPEEFDRDDHVGMKYWKMGYIRFREGYARVEEVDAWLEAEAASFKNTLLQDDEYEEGELNKQEETKEDELESMHQRSWQEGETYENQTWKAELEEEEAMWELGLVRYGGRWISVEEVEKIDVEEEERKVFSIWLRENEERQRMALLERFRDDNLSDGGVRELQELGEEMDGNDWSR